MAHQKWCASGSNHASQQRQMKMKYVVVTKVKSKIDKVYGPYDSYDEAQRNSGFQKLWAERKYAQKIEVTVRQLVDPSEEI
jgi:hypothetical protein